MASEYDSNEILEFVSLKCIAIEMISHKFNYFLTANQQNESKRTTLLDQISEKVFSGFRF